MSAPTVYTEATLAAYIVAALSDVASVLGWTAATLQVTEAVSETLLAYGADSIAEATAIRRLRAYARVEAWKAAVGALAARVDQEADGSKFARSAQHRQALAALKQAQSDLADVLASEAAPGGSGLVSSSAVLRATW